VSGASFNCRNRASSVQSSCKDDAKTPAETTSLLRAHQYTSDNDDDVNDDNDVSENASTVCQATVPSTPQRSAGVDNQALPTLQISSLQATSTSQSSSDLRRRWATLKRWFTPTGYAFSRQSSSTASPAIGLNDLRADHVHVPPVQPPDLQGRSSYNSDAAVVRLSSMHYDDDLLPTIGCCFTARSRDAAARMTSSSPGAAVCNAMMSGDAISTARLLAPDSTGARACSLSAAAAVNAACEPLLSPPATAPDYDDEDAPRTDCLTTTEFTR